jgi:hypothetical protein
MTNAPSVNWRIDLFNVVSLLSASKFWEKRHIWMQINEKGFYERAFNVTFGRNRKLRLP